MRVGEAESLEDFVEACRAHFGQGRPCLGCPQDESGEGTQAMIASLFHVGGKNIYSLPAWQRCSSFLSAFADENELNADENKSGVEVIANWMK